MAENAALYAPVGAIKTWAALMLRLISDEGLWMQKSSQSRLQARKFDIRAACDDYLALYTILAERRRHPG